MLLMEKFKGLLRLNVVLTMKPFVSKVIEQEQIRIALEEEFLRFLCSVNIIKQSLKENY